MNASPSNSLGASVPLEDEIRAQAYYLWLERGCPEGQELEDWLMAEAHVLRLRALEAAPPSPSAPPFPNQDSLAAHLRDPGPALDIEAF